MFMHFLPLTEPATPPQNVQATAFSSTQITVTRDEVPAIERNGIIVIYEVRFYPLQLTNIVITEYRNTTDMSVVLTGLQEYVEYNISVRAYTSVGPGPLSEDVTERTFEDRELVTLLITSSMLHTLSTQCRTCLTTSSHPYHYHFFH